MPSARTKGYHLPEPRGTVRPSQGVPFARGRILLVTPTGKMVYHDYAMRCTYRVSKNGLDAAGGANKEPPCDDPLAASTSGVQVRSWPWPCCAVPLSGPASSCRLTSRHGTSPAQCGRSQPGVRRAHGRTRPKTVQPQTAGRRWTLPGMRRCRAALRCCVLRRAQPAPPWRQSRQPCQTHVMHQVAGDRTRLAAAVQQ